MNIILLEVIMIISHEEVLTLLKQLKKLEEKYNIPSKEVISLETFLDIAKRGDCNGYDNWKTWTVSMQVRDITWGDDLETWLFDAVESYIESNALNRVNAYKFIINEMKHIIAGQIEGIYEDHLDSDYENMCNEPDYFINYNNMELWVQLAQNSLNDINWYQIADKVFEEDIEKVYTAHQVEIANKLLEYRPEEE